MLTTVAIMAAITLCLVMWKSAPAGSAGSSSSASDAGAPNLKEHGAGLKDHGKKLNEKVSGKKCPHCGKPI